MGLVTIGETRTIKYKQMKIPVELCKEYFDETGDNHFLGVKYIQWLEAKLLEHRQVKNSVRLSLPSDEEIRKQAVKYGTQTIKGHKRWKQTNQMKIDAFLEGAKIIRYAQV